MYDIEIWGGIVLVWRDSFIRRWWSEFQGCWVRLNKKVGSSYSSSNCREPESIRTYWILDKVHSWFQIVTKIVVNKMRTITPFQCRLRRPISPLRWAWLRLKKNRMIGSIILTLSCGSLLLDLLCNCFAFCMFFSKSDAYIQHHRFHNITHFCH